MNTTGDGSCSSGCPAGCTSQRTSKTGLEQAWTGLNTSGYKVGMLTSTLDFVILYGNRLLQIKVTRLRIGGHIFAVLFTDASLRPQSLESPHCRPALLWIAASENLGRVDDGAFSVFILVLCDFVSVNRIALRTHIHGRRQWSLVSGPSSSPTHQTLPYMFSRIWKGTREISCLLSRKRL